MTILRKQPGLPFLLALGILLILSASFLAVQLWSDGASRRGAAHALEAPVMPKALDVSKKGNKPAAKKNVGVVSPEEMIEAPVVPATPVTTDVVPVDDKPVQDVAVASVEPLVKEEAAAAKAKESEVVTKKPSNEDKPAIVSGPSSDNASVEEKKVVKSVEKTTKKAKKAKKAKKQVVEEDSLVVPPEWDWFSTPLKIEISQGQVEIVPAKSLRQVQLNTVVAKIPAGLFEPVVVEKVASADETTSEAVASTSKPFAAAVARMAKIRQLRDAREARESSKGVVVETVAPAASSPTMRRMGEVIKDLVIKLDRLPVPVEPSVDAISASPDATETVIPSPSVESTTNVVEDVAVAPVAAQEASEKLETTGENQFKPYYAGSGSSFSNRVNEMIRRGQYLKD